MTAFTPDFTNLEQVLDRQTPDRPTLFEFFLNTELYERLAGRPAPDPADPAVHLRFLIQAFTAAGYDYTTTMVPGFGFATAATETKASKSLDGTACIRSRADFEAYRWPDPAQARYEVLDAVRNDLPGGMKLIVFGPGGVLENVISLCGYEGLCYLQADDPGLVQEIFDLVGSRLVEYYCLAAPHSAVGACISNDDWGFKTQTMLRLDDMRQYVFPWHKRIVEAIHGAGRPAILHSCGRAHEIMDDIIDDMKYDGKHSYEDAIQPVEEAYDAWSDRIAVMGGIDVDFLCRSSAEDIRQRVLAMLERTGGGRAWGIGSGNSIPYYVPQDKYFAMINAVRETATVW